MLASVTRKCKVMCASASLAKVCTARRLRVRAVRALLGYGYAVPRWRREAKELVMDFNPADISFSSPYVNAAYQAWAHGQRASQSAAFETAELTYRAIVEAFTIIASASAEKRVHMGYVVASASTLDVSSAVSLGRHIVAMVAAGDLDSFEATVLAIAKQMERTYDAVDIARQIRDSLAHYA